MALGYDYLTFNGALLPWAKKAGAKMTNIETVGTSEAGTDLATVTRLLKPRYSYSFTVTDFWLDKLLTMCNLAQGTLKINNGADKTVRPRMSGYDLAQNSELTDGTDGLYDVQIDFIEV